MKKYVIYIIIFVLACITGVFAFKGYFPFNTQNGKFIHYWVYDSYHLAFNIPNLTVGKDLYYCKKIYEVDRYHYNNKLNSYYKEIDKFEAQITKIKQSKYYISSYDDSHVQYLYDMGHITKDYYYTKQGLDAENLLKQKYVHNQKCDNEIEILKRQIRNIEDVLIPQLVNEARQKFCIRLLQN